MKTTKEVLEKLDNDIGTCIRDLEKEYKKSDAYKHRQKRNIQEEEIWEND